MKIKIRMVAVVRETLDRCMSGGILMKSMEKEETPVPLELEQSVKWTPEWMKGSGVVDAPKFDGADP